MMTFTDLFHQELVIYNMSAKDDIEVLQNIFIYLHEHGYVEDGYCDMLIDREKNFPTGIDTEFFNVALPHTDPVHVIKPCILVIKLHEPVTFGMMGGDGNVSVDYVFGLVLKKMDGQVKLLQLIMQILTNAPTMQKLKHATCAEDIVAALYEYSEISNTEVSD